MFRFSYREIGACVFRCIPPPKVMDLILHPIAYNVERTVHIDRIENNLESVVEKVVMKEKGGTDRLDTWQHRRECEYEENGRM